MSEKDRDEIAGMLTNKGIEDLGAPWLAMGAAPTQGVYIPPLQPYVAPPPPPNIPADRGDDSGSLSLEAHGEAAGQLNRKKLDPYGAVRLRYGRSF